MTQKFKMPLVLLMVATLQLASCQSNQDIIAERSFKESMKSYALIFEESKKEKQQLLLESERHLDATSFEQVKQFNALVQKYILLLESFEKELIAYPRPYNDIETGNRFFIEEGNQKVMETQLNELFDFYKNSKVLFLGNDGVDVYFKNQLSFGKISLSTDIFHLLTMKVSISSVENAILNVVTDKYRKE